MRLLALLLLSLPSVLSDPTALTEYGEVIGFDYKDTEIFLGIPFAAPPIGNLRFKNPVPPEPWTEPKETKTWKDACVPHSSEAVTWRASEDCLYLNVFAPKRKEGNTDLAPVLFYIHGGGFEIGNAKLYGYEELAEIYASNGIVVVSIQYRIGVLGFFTLESSQEMSGNYGLFDMAEALHFVHRNIERFGGDPKRITTFGISAGGCAASMLTLSPLTRDLIAGSIEISGTAHAGWAIENRVEMHSADLLDAVGCSGKRTIQDMETCMRKVSVASLYSGVEFIFESAFSFNMLKFAPRQDGLFAPARYEDLAKTAPRIPVLTGINSLENGFFILQNRSPTIHRSAIFKGEIPGFDVDKWDMKSRILLNEFLQPDEIDEAVHDVLSFYLGEDYLKYSKPNSTEIAYLLEQYCHFWSDIYFNLPARYRADERREGGSEVYLYLFEHFNANIFEKDDPVKGSIHVNEMPYITGLQALAKFDWTEEESLVRDRSREMMRTFIKTGRPTVEGVVWPSYSSSPSAPFVRIASPKWTSEEGFMAANAKFWRETMSKYSYDFVRFQSKPAARTQIPAPPLQKDHEEL